MYGAEFDCGLNKTADNHILKFYLESLNLLLADFSLTTDLDHIPLLIKKPIMIW